MNSVIKKSIRNFRYVFSAQIIVLLFGIIRSLIVPILISVSDFAYWQMYLFYSSYVGIFALGFNDGIYLKYGGDQYEELPHRRLRSAIRIHLLVLFIGSIALLITSNFFDNEQRRIVIWIVSANILVMGINGVFIYILQITNQMKKYSFFSVLPKLIFLVGLIVIVFSKSNNFVYLAIIDLIAKFITVLGMILYCKELWIGENSRLQEAVEEYRTDVSIGIQLMIAQLMGMLVTGIGRLVVEIFGNIEDYAFYSFGMTLTNLVLVLITSISLLVYPTLKRLDENKYPIYYDRISSFLEKFSIIIPGIYFAAAFLIPVLLPKYSSVLIYLNILFGVIMLQAKMQLLNNTFYKILRKETAMMKANLNSVIFFTIIAVISFVFTKTVLSIAICTLVTIGWRTYASEVYLRKAMNIYRINGIAHEVIFILTFVIMTSYFSKETSIVLYGLYLLFNIYHNRDKLKDFISPYISTNKGSAK